MNFFDLDFPIAVFGSTVDVKKNEVGSFRWSIRDAVEGVQIFGGIGSGKTSGSGRYLALKYLKSGFGGLVLTAKADETETWKEYAKLTGRERDIIVVRPGSKNYFNFLQYESQKSGGKQALTANIVQVLKTVIKAGEQKDRGTGDDPFWEGALDLLMFNAIELCLLAYDRLDLKKLYDIVQTAPEKEEVERYWTLVSELDKPTSQHDLAALTKELDSMNEKAFWKAYSKAKRSDDEAFKSWMKSLPEDEYARLSEEEDGLVLGYFAVRHEAEQLESITQFFFETYSSLSDKTRSIIDFSFSSFVFRLLKEPVYSLFCKHDSSFVPEDCLNGKIIILDLPVKQYHKVGKDCQIMFKYIWQRAMERRDVTINNRPVFLWADEAQNFIHEHDAEYQATARSSRIATVYLTQNLSNYYANMGGSHSEHRVKSFLGTLNTKFFHANADVETNRYASDLMGEEYQESKTKSETVSGNFSSSESVTRKLEKWVRPEQFMSLKTGGFDTNKVVQAIMHKMGKPMENGLNFNLRSFSQTYIP